MLTPTRGLTGVAVLAWVALTLTGSFALVRLDIAERREQFRADARTAARLLSQQAARNDAMLSMLSLLAADGRPASPAMLAALPHLDKPIVGAARREAGAPWPVDWAGLVEAEALSAATPATGRLAAMAGFDPETARYTLVRAGPTDSHALRIDARGLFRIDDWPVRDGAPIEVGLRADGHELVLSRGAIGADVPFGLTDGFVQDEPIGSKSQPLSLVMRVATGPAAWPWPRLVGWALASALLVTAVAAVARARRAQRRAAEVARLSGLSRLDNLGELAAGIAHELNQPLAAVLASARAAERVLSPESGPASPGPQSGHASELPGSGPAPQPGRASGHVPGRGSVTGSETPDSLPRADAPQAADQPIDAADAALAREAIALAAAQARRAADVLARLRRLMAPIPSGRPREPVRLDRLVADLLTLLATDLGQRSIRVRVSGHPRPIRADPVAIEQIIGNLVTNAAQALAARPRDRQIDIELVDSATDARVIVSDNGPGIAADVRARLFEPFVTTRPDGLGLGLALCESLVRAQGGRLDLAERGEGACFVVVLSRAPDTNAPAALAALPFPRRPPRARFGPR